MLKKIEGSIHDHVKQKDGGYEKKSQIKLLEAKKMNEMKNILDGNNSSLAMADKLT